MHDCTLSAADGNTGWATRDELEAEFGGEAVAKAIRDGKLVEHPGGAVTAAPAEGELLTAALDLAEKGFYVFPCKPGNKTPATAHGLKDATRDAEIIRRWWTAQPDASIGLSTDGLLVLDIDGADNGWPGPDRSYSLLSAGGVQKTANGGSHFIFKQPPGKTFRNTASKLASKVDTRANGGYIVVAPSRLDGDRRYAWIDGLELCHREELPLPPAWLVDSLDTLERPRSNGEAAPAHDGDHRPLPDDGEIIGLGSRNDSLASIAGRLRRLGLEGDDLLAALQTVNLRRCQPPLPDAEVEKIAASVSRYEIDVPALDDPPRDGKEQPKPGPVVQCLADIEPRSVSWLWHGRFPLGRLSLLVGRPGEGKSFLTTDMAARVSTGTRWPDGADCPKGSVLLLNAEDDPHDTTRPRLDAHYADVRRVHLLRGVRRVDEDGAYERLITLADVDAIEAALASLPDCRLVVIDPIGSFLGGGTDAHRDNEIRHVLAPIAALAEKFGPAVLAVAHCRKSSGAIADDLALGSRAFTGISRAVWHLTRDRESKARRLLLPGKNNLSAEGDGLAFSIIGDPPRLSWERDPVRQSADEALAAENAARERKHGPEAEATTAAEEWLKATLADGPRPAKELLDEWLNGQGGAKRTLDRAKVGIKAEAFRPEVPGPWFWRLPAEDSKVAKFAF